MSSAELCARGIGGRLQADWRIAISVLGEGFEPGDYSSSVPDDVFLVGLDALPEDGSGSHAVPRAASHGSHSRSP